MNGHQSIQWISWNCYFTSMMNYIKDTKCYPNDRYPIEICEIDLNRIIRSFLSWRSGITSVKCLKKSASFFGTIPWEMEKATPPMKITIYRQFTHDFLHIQTYLNRREYWRFYTHLHSRKSFYETKWKFLLEHTKQLPFPKPCIDQFFFLRIFNRIHYLSASNQMRTFLLLWFFLC